MTSVGHSIEEKKQINTLVHWLVLPGEQLFSRVKASCGSTPYVTASASCLPLKRIAVKWAPETKSKGRRAGRRRAQWLDTSCLNHGRPFVGCILCVPGATLSPFQALPPLAFTAILGGICYHPLQWMGKETEPKRG